MLDHAGLTIHIVVNGQELDEYLVPGSCNLDTMAYRTRHVQATVGASFAVKVEVSKDFRWQGAKALLVQISLDGQPTINSFLQIPLFKQYSSYTWDEITVACPDDKNVTRKARMMFGGVECGMFAADGHKPLSVWPNDAKVDHDIPDFPSERISNLGTAVVTVQRGFVGRPNVREGSGQALTFQPGIAQVPEKLLKGSTKSIAVKYAPSSRSPPYRLSRLN